MRDRDWFLAQVRVEQARLRGFLRSLGVRFESVDDLAQDVFLQAWKSLESFEQPGDFGAWIRRIAVNLVSNERRKQARHSRLVSSAVTESLISTMDSAPGPLESFQQKEAATILRECLSKLPRRGGELLKLRYFEGLTPGAIAGRVQQPSNRVRQSLIRWRRVLGECLEKRLDVETV